MTLQPARVVTGPQDGKLIDCLYMTYQVATFDHEPDLFDPENENTMESLEIEVLTYRRVTYKVLQEDAYVDFFVPDEWTDDQLDKKMLDYFIKKAIGETS